MAKALPTRSVSFSGDGAVMGIPKDSGAGMLGRPFLSSGGQGDGPKGGRVATLETLFEYYIDNVLDPDFALASDPNADEMIRQQPDVAAAMRLRELTVASMPWSIEAAKVKEEGKMELSKEIAEFVQETFDNLPNICDFYRGLQTAVLQGGVGYEFIWEKNEEGVEVPVNYYQVHKTRFIFDRMGRMALLTRQQPVWGAYVAQPNQPPQPQLNGTKAWFPTVPGKFIYHTYMKEGGSWYRPATEGFNYWGRGENNNLYNLVLFDQFVTRFRIKFLERFGYPLTVLYYPDGDDNAAAQLTQIAQQVRKEVIASIPRRGGDAVDGLYKLDYFQPNMSGQDYFEKFQEQFIRTKIEKIVLGGANLMQLGPTGSYGASVDQRDSGSEIIFRFDAKNISETLNLQLIPHIVWSKYPDCPKNMMPKHVMAPKQAPDRQADLQALQTASALVPITRADIYRAAGLEPPKADTAPEEIVFSGQAPDMVGGLDNYPAAFMQGNGKKVPAKDDEGDDEKQDGKPANGKDAKGGKKKPKKPIGKGGAPKQGRPVAGKDDE